jgi:hypothetical protein
MTSRLNPKSKEQFADLKPAQETPQGAPETSAATQPSAEPQQPAGGASVPVAVTTTHPARPGFVDAAVPDGYVRKRGVRDPGIALNVRIPTPLFARLQNVASSAGILQKDIVARALEKELDLIERMVPERQG